MKDLGKVNGSQLESVWKNFSMGLFVMMGTLILSRVLPFYFSPIIGLIAAAVLYTQLYNHKLRKSASCMVVPYALFYCMISYSFCTIILNVLYIWNIIPLPKELTFFADPFIPALVMDPVCVVTVLIFYVRRNRLSICIDCKLTRGLSIERGKLGEILTTESKGQLTNMIWIFGLLSAVTWGYYLLAYASTNVNPRDWYVFLGLNVIVLVLDMCYYASRYYNIYLDLKENGEIITEEELSDMTAKTYLRCYLICGNKIFLNSRIADPTTQGRQVIDTPFVTKRNVNGVSTSEVRDIVARMCGDNAGELRFLFGRRSPDLAKHRILRYAYFVGEDNACPALKVAGEWLDFNAVKVIYNEAPGSMSAILVSDITRITTIILTQKLFDERGYRKIKAKSYMPTYDLKEIRDNNYDFQNEKWIRVSLFNSDIPGFQFKRWWARHFGNRNNNEEWEQKR